VGGGKVRVSKGGGVRKIWEISNVFIKHQVTKGECYEPSVQSFVQDVSLC